MPTQKELLDSAKMIDQRLAKAKTVIKDHKQKKREAIRLGETDKPKIEARQNGRLI